MPLIETGPRVVVSVVATGGGDWQVVSTPTGFQGITSALFADNDYIHAAVRFENGVDWEEYDTDDDSTTNLLQIANVTGTVTLTRPAVPYASSNGGARVTDTTGTHTLFIGLGSGTMRRIFREINGSWKTFTSGDATPDVSGYRLFKTAGTTTITAFDNMEAGKLFIVQRGASDIAIADGANISLPGDRNLTLTANQPAALFAEDGGVAVLVALFPNLLLLQNGVAATELTIASGAITPTQASHTVDTEADAASDALDTITATNFKAGDILTLAAASAARTVVVTHNAGNIKHPHGASVSLDDAVKTVQIRYDGTFWNVLASGAIDTNFIDAVKDYGFVADNSTDNYSAWAAMMAAATLGQTIYFPPAALAYKIVLPTAHGGLAPAADLTIRSTSMGAATLHFAMTGGDTGFVSVFNHNNDNFTLEDISVICTPVTLTPDGNGDVSGGGITFINQEADNLFVRRIDFDGGLAIQSGTRTSNVFLVTFTTNDTQGTFIEDCVFRDFSRLTLKAGIRTNTNIVWRMIGNIVETCFAQPFDVNTVDGVIDDVIIADNYATGHKARLLTAENSGNGPPARFYWACAGGTNITVENNTFDGGHTHGHIEEHAAYIVVRGNKHSGDHIKALETVENNIAGTYSRPTNMTIEGNVGKTTTVVAGSRGIDIQSNGVTTEQSAERSIVSENVMEGYDINFYDNNDQHTSTILWTDNVAVGGAGDIGFAAYAAHTGFENNLSDGCATAYSSTNGGLWGFNAARGHTTLVTTTSTGRVTGMEGFRILFSGLSFTSSSNNYLDVIPLTSATRVRGNLHGICVLRGGGGTAEQMAFVDYDGAVSLAADAYGIDAGPFTGAIAHPDGSGADAHANFYALRVFAASAATSPHAEATFRGLFALTT